VNPEEEGYAPCSDCGDESSETMMVMGVWRCEKCRNYAVCGCEVCLNGGVTANE
jgi:hypothetical protein